MLGIAKQEMAETVIGSVISSSLAIAQECAWRVSQYAIRKWELEGTSAETVLKALFCSDDVGDKIHKLSLSNLQAARSHIRNAVQIMHESTPNSEFMSDPVDEKLDRNLPTSIPQKAAKLAKEAYKEASRAYANDGLAIKERATAAQIIMTATAIWHFDDPSTVSAMWAEQIRQFSRSAGVRSCIRYRLSSGWLDRIRRIFIRVNEDDFKQVVTFVRDASQALRFFPFPGARRALIDNLAKEKVREKWTRHLQLTRHNYDIPLDARSFDIVALDNARLLMSTMMQKLYAIQLGPRLATDEIAGHFSTLAMDPYREKIWALKSTNEFFLFHPDKKFKDQNAEPMEGPFPPEELKRWRMATAEKFVIVAAEFETGAKNTKLLAFMSDGPGDSTWDQLDLSSVFTSDKTVLSAAAVYRKAEGIRLVFCVPAAIYVITLDPRPPFHVKNSRRLLADKFTSPAMQCCVDEMGRLVVAVWRDGVYVLDPDWEEVKQYVPDSQLHQPQGISARDSQIYVLLPNFLRVFDYV